MKKLSKIKIIFLPILFLGLFGLAESSEAWTIPADRKVDWQGNAGAFTDWSATRTQTCTTLSPSGGNDTTQITNALNNCPSGQVVKLNSGTFLINSTINWPKDYVSLRGSGSQNTILQIQSGLDAGTVFEFPQGQDYDWTVNTNHVVSSGYIKGSTQITTSTSHGWAAGDFVLIDQANDTIGPPMFDTTGYDGTCTWCSRDRGSGRNRYFGQVVKITNIDNATTASFTPPLYQTYNPSFDVRAVSASSDFWVGISIENLKVNNSAYYAKYIVRANGSGLLNSVISGVEFDGLDYSSDSGFFRFRNTAFLTVKDSWWHNNEGDQQSADYGLWFMYGCSANLVVNNITSKAYAGFVTEGGPNSGHVVAYNYFYDPFMEVADGVLGYVPVAHYNNSYMILFEGNITEEGKIRSDSATGSSMVSNTFFRNRVIGDATRTMGNSLVDFEHGQYYNNFVGNVFGTVGLETKYECYNTGSNCDSGAHGIYRLGYPYPWDERSPFDTAVKITMLRHYNWDSVTNGTKICTDSGEPGCQGGASDTVIPTSLYYFSKPSWWCNETPWPPIGPDVSGYTNAIPAKRRYLGQSCTLGAADTTPPAAPQGLSVS